MANTKEYTQALLGLLPQGKAWQGKNLRALLGAWAEESAHVDSSMSGLLRESNPATAKEMLPEWERLLAITPAKRATLAQRRQVVLARLTNGAVVNDTALANLALALGWRLEFTYFKPARSGTAKSGQRNYKAGWVYAKRITGGAVARGMVSIQTLKATFTNTQPAHQAWLWALTGDPTDGSTNTRDLERARARL